MTENAAQGIIDSMADLLSHHSALLELAGRKKEVLIKGNLPELEGVVLEEQALIRKVGEAEAARIEAVKGLLEGQECDPAGMKVEALVPFLSPQKGEELQALKERLVRILRKLQEANETNSELIRLSLNYIDFMLETFTGATGGMEVYSPGHQDGQKSGLSQLLDRRA